VGECPAGGALLWTVTIRLNLSCWRLIQQAVSVYAGGPYWQRTDTDEGVEKELVLGGLTYSPLVVYAGWIGMAGFTVCKSP